MQYREDTRPRRGKRPRTLRSYRRINPERLLDQVRECVSFESGGFTKEEIARELRVRTHRVGHALHVLNLEGLVTQPSHSIPHDCFRHPWCGTAGFSSWEADRYYRRESDVED
jgi:hypothetical protein